MIAFIPYLFALAAVSAILAEIIRPSFSYLWLLPSAAAGTVTVFSGLPEWLAVLVFFLSYGVFFLVGRAMLRLFYSTGRK